MSQGCFAGWSQKAPGDWHMLRVLMGPLVSLAGNGQRLGSSCLLPGSLRWGPSSWVSICWTPPLPSRPSSPKCCGRSLPRSLILQHSGEVQLRRGIPGRMQRLLFIPERALGLLVSQHGVCVRQVEGLPLPSAALQVNRRLLRTASATQPQTTPRPQQGVPHLGVTGCWGQTCSQGRSVITHGAD